MDSKSKAGAQVIQGARRFTKSRLSSPSPDSSDDDTIPPFEAVSKNLVVIGALTIGRYLRAPVETDDFDIPHHIRDTREKSAPPPPTLPVPTSSEPKEVKSDAQSKMQCVAQLHHTCQRVFGKTDLLKFEFIEVDGPNTKRCILTITRPNGAKRSYTTPAVYSRKNEAKSQTASLAVEMGAIDFITTGDVDPLKANKGMVLAPLDASGEEGAVEPEPEDPLVQEIEDCCVQWRAGRVKPYWIALNEPKAGSKQGCALRIELSPHSLRVYSVTAIYATLREAKAACAKTAHDQGVIEFIKHGNGQIKPENPAVAISDADADAQEAETKAIYSPPTPLTLQGFYDTFPQPFPESWGDKSVAEFNGPSWLNITIQGARGAKFSTSFTWTTNGTLWGGTLGLHGCLLRIDRPEESRSYLVDARFLKRADAKAAVCLQAISQGAGDYIRRIGNELENKITPNMKRWANELIFPTLGSECGRARPGMHPRYEFQKDRDAYGCSMTLELSSFPTPEETKTYSVPTEYRTKVDAKIALACHAAEQGAVEFLRFRGGPVPAHYQTFHSALINGTADVPNKRKNWDDDGLQDRKRLKTMDSAPRSGGHHAPLLETKEEAVARLNAQRSFPSASHPYQPHSRDNKPGGDNGWNKPIGPVLGGFGGIPRPAQGPPISQFHPGNRNMGNTPPNGSTIAAPMKPPAQNSKRGPPQLWNRNGSSASLNADPDASSSTRPRPNPTGPPPLSAGNPINLGLPDRPSFLPAPQQRPTHNNNSTASPQPPQVQNMSRPPPPPFPQPVMYPPPPGLQQNPIAPGYYPHPGIQPYGFLQQPPQFAGPRPGFGPPHAPVHPQFPHQYGNMSAPALPYGPYPGSQFPQASHFPPPPPYNNIYQHQPQHHTPPYYGTPPPSPMPPMASGAGYGAPQYPGTAPQMSVGPPLQSTPATQQQPAPARPQHSPTPKSEDVTKGASSNSALEPKPSLDNTTQPSDEDIQLTITPVPIMHLTALIDYCSKKGLPEPLFHDKIATDAKGKISPGKLMHKVWIVMGGEKLELPVTFRRVNEGRERLAKQVLGRLRSQEKADAKA